MNNSIILHPSSKTQIDNLLASNQLNSIGLSGPVGVGKSFIAQYLVKNILNLKDAAADPYVKFLDCSDSVGIDEIRQVKTFLRLKVPSQETYNRAVVFEHIEMLGLPAQNSLLKTLEEPPTGTIIIATANSKATILPTISSRLQWLRVLPVSKNQISRELAGFGQTELDRAYLLSDGNVGTLLSLLDQPDAQTYHQAAIDQAKLLVQATRFEKLAEIETILKTDDYTLDQLLQAMLKVIRSALERSTTPRNISKLTAMLSEVAKSRQSLKYNLSPKLILVSLLNKI